ncbi:hypothetical protein Tco_0250631 [Tanacetum coccineum]
MECHECDQDRQLADKESVNIQGRMTLEVIEGFIGLGGTSKHVFKQRDQRLRRGWFTITDGAHLEDLDEESCRIRWLERRKHWWKHVNEVRKMMIEESSSFKVEEMD